MLKEQISGFIAYCKVSGFKPKSIESLSLRLAHFNDFINSCRVKRIQSIQYLHLRQFIADYQSPSIHVKKARIWSLRQFYHYLMLKGHVKDNITSDLAYPRMEKTVPQFLTIAEYNRIMEYCTTRIGANGGLRNLIILLLLGMLGLRTGAVIGLNYQDVNLVAGLLWVREKGGIGRAVVMPKVLCNLLQHYTTDRPFGRGPLLLSKRSKRFSLRSLQMMFAEMMGAVGIDKHLHAHLFRHTAGAHLNKVGGTGICQYVLGHARRSNTLKYAHLNPDHYAVFMRCHPFVKEGL